MISRQLTAAATIAALLFPACRKQPEKALPIVGPITESVYASGVVKSRGQYQVFPAVGGLIEKIWVKEGDLVKKGDPLFTVEGEAARLQAENARLNADFADLNTRSDRLSELLGGIETARSRMLNDSILLVRQQGLWAQGIGSQVEFEQRGLAFENSANNWRAAVLRYNDLKKQLDFAAAQSRKLLSISKHAVVEFTVRSEMDGRVFSFSKEKGEMVGPQTPVAVVGAASDFMAELQVDENDIVRVAPGQRVLLTMDSYGREVFEAQVSRIDPMMNERTRTFTVEAVFVKKPPVLYPFLSLEANIVVRSKPDALTVPRAFLLDDSLLVMENGQKRRVETGLMDYQKAEILRGLSAGEAFLKPGK